MDVSTTPSIARADLGPSRRWYAFGWAVWVLGLCLTWSLAHAASSARSTADSDRLWMAAIPIGALVLLVATTTWLVTGWVRRTRHMAYFETAALAPWLDVDDDSLWRSLGWTAVVAAALAVVTFVSIGVVVDAVERVDALRPAFPRGGDSPVRFFVSTVAMTGAATAALVGAAEWLRGRRFRALRPVLLCTAALAVPAVLAKAFQTGTADVVRLAS